MSAPLDFFLTYKTRIKRRCKQQRGCHLALKCSNEGEKVIFSAVLESSSGKKPFDHNMMPNLVCIVLEETGLIVMFNEFLSQEKIN